MTFLRIFSEDYSVLRFLSIVDRNWLSEIYLLFKHMQTRALAAVNRNRIYLFFRPILYSGIMDSHKAYSNHNFQQNDFLQQYQHHCNIFATIANTRIFSSDIANIIAAYLQPVLYTIIDVGCIECTVPTSIVAVCSTKEKACQILRDYYQTRKTPKSDRCSRLRLKALETETNNLVHRAFSYFDYGEHEVLVSCGVLDQAAE